ncbi:MAG: mechanosensitive ion channel family protein [Paludibacteraceae bacterium]|jgi:small-conductance mechanosensitive channel|nr:mechanosensitive ion channel family protein [Paludibacteraceae bacterium]
MNTENITLAFNKIITDIVNWLLYDFTYILISLVVVIVLIWLLNAISRNLEKVILKRSDALHDKEAQKRVKTLMSIGRGIMRLILWAIFALILLKRIGIEIGPIIASAGIAGIAIGFGAQELIRDFLAGFFVLLDNQIRTDDIVVINGTTGVVEKIELRTIRLRDHSGVVHIFQHGKVNTLSNMTKEWSALVFEIGVAYKEDVDTVIAIMKSVGEDLEKDSRFSGNILEPISILGVEQFANSSIQLKVRIKTQTGEQWQTRREYMRRLKYAFDKKGIEIPFPHTTLYWGEKSKPMDISLQK